MNITEATLLYNKLHKPAEDRVKNHLVSIHNGISEAVYDAKDYVFYSFQRDDTEQTIEATCDRLKNNGFTIEHVEQVECDGRFVSRSKSYPARIAIYGWVKATQRQ
jgi:hypothetical protein